MNYLKVSRAPELQGADRRLYRFLEILPGALSWLTLLGLIVLAYFQPVWVAVFLIFFDVYWLLLVLYLGIHLLASYRQLKKNLKINWLAKCQHLGPRSIMIRDNQGQPTTSTLVWQDMYHLIVLPVYLESLEIIRTGLQSLINDGYPTDKMIVVLAMEEATGSEAHDRAKIIEQEFQGKFKQLFWSWHPANIPGEFRGKGSNQAWAARQVKQEIIDAQNIDYHKILVSVFDIDTIVRPGYFGRLTHAFLTVPDPYRASYQPIPVYHNNIWQAPFFSRIAAFSNTFWQMIQQVRSEKLATYSSHSMTWQALVDIDFWSTNMVSEDSRIFFHCFCHYQGVYRVEPLYYPVSMDACLDKRFLITAQNLYKQQRRWGWGVENLPYLVFNTIKRWKNLQNKRKFLSEIFLVQMYGFHSWATYALIIAVVGWTPILLGGDAFNTTVVSTNLPFVTRWLMTLAMIGLVISAILSNLMLPKRPKTVSVWKNLAMVIQWLILPFTIVFFGSIPALEAQTRLLLGKYMGFWHTPKER